MDGKVVKADDKTTELVGKRPKPVGKPLKVEGKWIGWWIFSSFVRKISLFPLKIGEKVTFLRIWIGERSKWTVKRQKRRVKQQNWWESGPYRWVNPQTQNKN